MTTPTQAFGTMPATLEQSTGRSLDAWLELVRGLGIEKHGQILAELKTTYGLSHGYANMIALLATGYGQQADDELVAGLFAGSKAGLRPIYDRVLALVAGLGEDVETVPKKTMVSFRRTKQFACFTPMSAKRIDLGVNLRGDLAADAVGVARLKPTPGGMASHVFPIGDPDEVDDEVADWIARAYEVN